MTDCLAISPETFEQFLRERIYIHNVSDPFPRNWTVRVLGFCSARALFPDEEDR
jgi:hypothetical protein